MMRIILAALLIGVSSLAFAFDRAERVEMFTEMVKAELAKKGEEFNWKVEDTGQTADFGAGDGPLVTVTIPGKHTCLVSIHPVDETAAVLGCEPLLPPGTVGM
jgi:hypothetical protein